MRAIGSLLRLRLSTPWQLLLVALLSLVAGVPILLSGYIDTHAYGDSPFVLLRLIALDQGIADGALFPRWAADFGYGYGYPFFNFYAPLAYYVAEVFHWLGLGIASAAEAAFLLGFVLSGAGMYLLVRRLAPTSVALLCSIAYVYAPYHFANAYLRGDALAEFFAYGLFPWVLWAAHRLVADASVGRTIILAALYGALVLTHNISAILFSAVLVVFCVVLLVGKLLGRSKSEDAIRSMDSDALLGVAERSYLHLGPAPSGMGAQWGSVTRSLIGLVVAALLGLGLSAFFWAPALAERGDVHMEYMTSGYFDFHGHFLSLSGMVDDGPAYDYLIEGQGSAGLPFKLGLAQTLVPLVGVAILIVFWLWVRLTRRKSGQQGASPGAFALVLALFAVLALCVAFLVSPASAWVWEHVPLLPMVQFPWRLLSYLALCLAVVSGAIALPFARRRLVWAVVGVVGLALTVSATWGLLPGRMDLSDAQIGRSASFAYEYTTSSIGTTCRYEYLPRWVSERPWSSGIAATYPDTRRQTIVQSQGADVEVLADESYRKALVTKSDGGGSIVLGTFYFPGWQAKVNGEAVPISPSSGSGLIALNVPAGTSSVEVVFGGTPLRDVATAISLVCLAILVVGPAGIALWRRRRQSGPLMVEFPAEVVDTETESAAAKWPSTTLGVAVAFVAAWACVGVVWASALSGPQGAATIRNCDTLSADAHSPMAHEHSDGIAMQGGWTFVGYRGLGAELQPPSSLDLELLWGYPGGPESLAHASVEVRLRSPAVAVLGLERDFAIATASLEPDARSGLAVARLRLEVPSGVPPGLYYVYVSLADAGRVVPVLGSTGAPTDRGILLGPVAVRRTVADSGAAPTLGAKFGTSLALEEATAIGDDALRVSLSWRALDSMSTSYKVSLRLVDDAGELWGQSDSQMVDGLYPTTAWEKGELVRDLHDLRPVPGTPPGTYTVEVRVYDPADMKALPVVAGNKSTDHFTLSGVSVEHLQPPRAPGQYMMKRPVEAALTSAIRVVAANAWADAVRTGDTLYVTVGLLATAAVDASAGVNVELMAQDGVVAQQSFPLAGKDRSLALSDGNFLRSVYGVVVPRDLPSGQYSVRLTMADGSGSPVVLPGVVNVVSRPLVTSEPSPKYRLSASLGSAIALVGYDLDPDGQTKAGEAITVTAYWRSAESTDKSYKVFVHVADRSQRVWAQDDSYPARGEAQTNTWIQGEYVTDAHAIRLPADIAPGQYDILVGVYDEASGQRLVATVPGASPSDHVVLGQLSVGQ